MQNFTKCYMTSHGTRLVRFCELGLKILFSKFHGKVCSGRETAEDFVRGGGVKLIPLPSVG